MSIELLPTVEKKSDTSKKSDSVKETGAKKEGGSLFDSLLKNAVSGKNQSKTAVVQNQKETLENNKTTSKNNTIEKTETTTIDKAQIKQLSDELVEIVVEKAKTIKSKSELLEDEKQIKQKVEDLKESIKATVEDKTGQIKKAVEQIEKAVKSDTPAVDQLKKAVDQTQKIIKSESQVVEQTHDEKKTQKAVEKSDEPSKQKITTATIEKIQENRSEIKKASQEIVKTVSVLDSQSDKISKDKNLTVEEVSAKQSTTEGIKKVIDSSAELIGKISDEIEQDVSQKSVQVKNDSKGFVEIETQSITKKTDQIKEAVEVIEKTVSKITFVSTQEIVKSIQELKKELEPKLSQYTQSDDEKSTITLQNSKDRSFLAANGFLQEQGSLKQKVSLQQLNDAKKNIMEEKTLQSVTKSANMLELNPKELEVEAIGKEGESKAELFSKNNKQINEMLHQQKSYNKMAINNQLETIQNQERMNTQAKVQEQKQEASSSINNSSQNQATPKEPVVQIQVPQQAVETIQSKIIGAQQKMGSFMSDVARSMYLNYKPPFTAFRMNLNPENLGSIAVMMRASKADNSITVSMNMSSSNTMEAFTENRAALQNALQKQLGEGSNITLNFGMENGQNEQNSNDFLGNSNQNSQNQDQNKQSSSSNEDEQQGEQTTRSTDYM
jgi:hypothetical protein